MDSYLKAIRNCKSSAGVTERLGEIVLSYDDKNVPPEGLDINPEAKTVALCYREKRGAITLYPLVCGKDGRLVELQPKKVELPETIPLSATSINLNKYKIPIEAEARIS